MPTNAVGDMLLWVIATTNNEGGAASFSVPGGWAQVATIVDGSFPSERLSVYSKTSSGSESAPTVTITDSGITDRRTLAHMLSYRNVTTVDASNTEAQTTTSNSATSPSVTTTVANTRIVTAFRNWALAATGTHSWASSTERTDAASAGGGGFLRMSVADKAQAAAGASATEVVTTSSNFDNRQFIVLALRP